MVNDMLKWIYAALVAVLFATVATAQSSSYRIKAGDTLTIPDIVACHCLNWAVGAKFPRVDDKLFEYAKALRERAAFQAAFAR